MTDQFDLNLLFAALDAQRIQRGLSWSSVAKEIEERYVKVSPSTIKGIREKANVEGDGCLQMMLWLEKTPESFVPGLAHEDRFVLKPASKGILRFDVEKVYRLLESKRESDEITWGEVAEQIGGLSAQMLKRFEKGGRTSFPGIMRVARWLDVPIAELTRESPW